MDEPVEAALLLLFRDCVLVNLKGARRYPRVLLRTIVGLGQTKC